MKLKILFALLLLFAITTVIFAADPAPPQDPGNTVSVTTTAQSSGFEFANSWMQIALLLIILMLILASLAFMFGKAFNLPDVLAFARVELVQIITNALIVVFIFAIITFVDVLMVGMVNESDLPNLKCDSNQYCIGVVAVAYTQDLVDLIYSDIDADLAKSIEAGAASAESSGLSCHKLFDPWWFPCYGFLSVGWATEKYKSMDVDRYAIDLEYYNSYLSSLLAQKFFAEKIIPAFAPFILFLGIITRSFFATRKLGGLLIAIALGVMFVFPLMFVFNWMSLNIMLYGDAAIGGSASSCPLECQKAFPVAYNIDPNAEKKIYYTRAELRPDLIAQGVPANQLETKLENLIAGQAGNELSGTIISCNATFFADCSQICRQLPMPTGSSCWGNLGNETGCSKYPEVCKIKQTIDPATDTQYDEKVAMCVREGGEANPGSSFCKTILPMKNDCNIGTPRFEYTATCDDHSGELNHYSEFTFSSDYVPNICNLPNFCLTECTYDNLGNINCPYNDPNNPTNPNVAHPCNLPETCETECSYNVDGDLTCPEYSEEINLCRLSASCFTDCNYDDKGRLVCPSECTDQLSRCGCFSIAVKQTEGNCLLAKPSCRVVYREDFNENPDARGTGEKACDLNAAKCPASLNPSESCVYILPKNGESCKECLKVEEDYQYSPPIRKSCADLCGAGADKGKASSTGDIVKNSGSDYVGPEDVKNVSKFMIPAFVLPLMNILVTLMFIKTLSGMLGGDIEIPGLSKVL